LQSNMDCKIGVIFLKEGILWFGPITMHYRFLFSGSHMSDILCRYLEFFQQFDFEVEWVSGASNTHADFLVVFLVMAHACSVAGVLSALVSVQTTDMQVGGRGW
jgi:hypothetical protein